MTKDEVRQMLDREMETMLAEALAAADGRDLTLTQLEDIALSARQEFGKRLMQQLIKQQVDRHAHELPQGGDGKNMQPKGKKTKRSSRAQAK